MKLGVSTVSELKPSGSTSKELISQFTMQAPDLFSTIYFLKSGEWAVKLAFSSFYSAFTK